MKNQRTNIVSRSASTSRGTEERDRIRNRYFLWLCSFVERRSSSERTNCLEFLFDKEFYGRLSNDENREEDGLMLRRRFCEENNEDVDYCLPNNPPTILEVLIALSMRIEYEVGDQPARWFWEMIDNLGLHIYEPSDPDARLKRRENDRIVEVFLEREYSRTGKGGIFPLRRSSRDQRRVEIWYQMQTYIQERYNID